MVVCKFYQQGNCRFGNNCKFEHPGANRNAVQTNNRFSAFQSSSSNGASQGRNDQDAHKPPYSLTRDGIIADLSTERPQWILSAYGPGLKAPAQLWGGDMREQSFEEMRLHYYLGMASGNPAAAAQQADSLIRDAESQIQNALQNVDGAMQYILSAENQHPNRIDICNGSSAQNGTASSNPFGSTPAPAASNPFGAQPTATPSPFGQPSALGQKVNPFSTSQPSSGAFGSPSALGARPSPFGAPAQTSAFGAPSALGANASPFGSSQQNGAFGSPSAMGQRPSPFGAPAQSQGAFGASSQPMSSPFGASAQTNPSPFGQPIQPAASNPFGASSQAAASPFGASQQQSAQPNPFGQSAQSNQPSNPFGAPSQPQTNPFGAPQQPAANPFGGQTQAQQTTSSPFSAPQQSAASNPFGTSQQPAVPNPFGSSQPPSTTANPFGSQTATTPSNPFQSSQQPQIEQQNPFGRSQAQPAAQNPFGAASSTPASQPQTNGTASSYYKPLPPITTGGITGPQSPYPSTSNIQHPPLQSYATVQPDGRLTMFRGKAVQYRDGVPGAMNRADRTWEKIWFPEGPPGFNADTQVDESLISDDMKKSYECARENGVFEGGIVPLMPPLREWCVWDF